MSLLRLIAKLEIKGPHVIKPIRFEGLRVVGKPAEMAKRYAQDADEIIFMDVVSTLYGRNQLTQLLEETVSDVFIPICVGGGIQSTADVKRLLRSGADKVAVNSAAVKRPQLVKEIADTLGSQGIVVSIEAKRTATGWEAYTDNGRERTGKDAVQWAYEAVELGAGEILLTSVDRDGTRKGFDTDLIREVSKVSVPLVACGGMGTIEHAKEALAAGADAIACASVLHYNVLSMKEIQEALRARNVVDGEDAELPAGTQGKLEERYARERTA